MSPRNENVRDPVADAHAAKSKAKASKVTPLATPDKSEPLLPLDEGDESVEILRLVRQETAALKAAGFSISDEALANIDALPFSEMGQDILKHYAEQARKVPLISEAAKAHEAQIALEKRKDYFIMLASYRLDAAGWIRKVDVVKDKGILFSKTDAAPISEVAFGQLRGFYDAYQKKLKKDTKGFSKEALPVTQRDPGRANVNAWIGKLGNKQARMRVRTVAGQREVFAFTGYSSTSRQTYTPFDTNNLLWEAARLVPEGVRCDVKYDVETARMRARCMMLAPIDVPSFKGDGRIHQVGFDISSGDDGTMGIFVRPFVIRTRCQSVTFVQDNKLQSNFRHVGGFETLKAAISTAIGHAAAVISSVRYTWMVAAGKQFLDDDTGDQLTPLEAINRLVYGGYVPTGDLPEEEAIENYVQAWKREGGGGSAQGIIMAIQRAAREGSWKNKWTDVTIEEAASKILYEQIYELPEVTTRNKETEDED